MSKKTKELIERCIGCGQPLKNGQPIKIIISGTQGVSGVTPFGKMHESPCFEGTVEQPDEVMAEIRRVTAKKTKKVSA